MTIDIFRRIGLFALLCLIQALVLNHIHLFGCAIPLFYIYFTLDSRRNYPRWGILLWSFFLGLAIDTFSNTPGVATASLTLIGVLQPYFFSLFYQQDAPDDIRPSMVGIGVTKYCSYVIPLVLLYCLVFFTLETFNFFNWLQWVKSVIGSTVLTVILILTIESVRKK